MGKRKRGRRQQGARPGAGHSRRWFLKIVCTVLTVLSSLDGLLSLGERVRKLLTQIPVNVVVTPPAGGLRIVVGTAVSVEEALSIAVGGDVGARSAIA